MYKVLEKRWSVINHGYPAIACSTGTSALHLAIEALQLPKGSQVIVPEFTMIACARAVSMAGLKPVFVDCKEDLNVNESLVPEVLTELTSAIMAVHIYGRRCNVDKLLSYGLPVIEDMSEIHGIKPHVNTSAACWSFYKNKIVCGEEGGITLFKERKHANIAERLKSHGFTEEHDFYHEPYGNNYRLSNSHSKMILDSLDEMGSNLAARSRVEFWYNRYVPGEYRMPRRDSCWVYDIRVPFGKNRKIVEILNSQNIAARLGFKAMSEQSEYIGHHRHLRAYQASKEIMYLPVSPFMTEDKVQWISEQLIKAISIS